MSLRCVGQKRTLSESSGSSGVGESASADDTDNGGNGARHNFYGGGGGKNAGDGRRNGGAGAEPPFKIPKKTDLMGQGTFAGRRESREASTASSSSFATSASSEEDDDEAGGGGAAASFVSPRGANGEGFYGQHCSSFATEVTPNDDAASVASTSSSASSTCFSSAAAAIAPKVARADERGEYSSFAQKMMSRMGYQEGKGLGKTGQGIVEPVGMSKQRGRRGLGLIIKGLEDEKVEWDPDREHVSVQEAVDWMPTPHRSEADPPELPLLRTWMAEGPRKLDISGEDRFCDPEVLANVLSCKSVFDKLEKDEMLKARTRSNPFETIRGAFFLNRAAMKMANMDAVFDFMFTDPVTPEGHKVLRENDLLYFADVCAGPGGFSEYVLWRKKWRARGFGFTLKGSHDFKTEDFFAGPPESFETHYGQGGRDGDGNVFKEENVREFEKHVLSCTDGLGVHFMMADGGFSVEGQENEQEILSKQLYLCQFLVALGIIRPGGHFVCKLFDVFTPFSVGLLYLMRRCFEKVCLHKPNTSRPANSERYIVCKWKKPDTRSVHDYFFEVNCRINQLGYNLLGQTESDTDVNEIVPLDVILSDSEFVKYVVNSNNVLGDRQVVGLIKIAAFTKDQSLYELRQAEIKDQCLYEWKIPNEARKAPTLERPNAKLDSLVAEARREAGGAMLTSDFLTSPGRVLGPANLATVVRSAYDFKFVLLGSDPDAVGSAGPGFYLGIGRSKIFRLSSNRRTGGTSSSAQLAWEKVDESQMRFELPAGTLIYAEQVNEWRGEGRSSRRVAVLHVIDAVFVAGQDLTRADVKRRSAVIEALCKSMHKPTRNDYVRLRPKELLRLEDLPAVMDKMVLRVLKSGGMRPRLTYPIKEDAGDGHSLPRYFVPAGLMLFRVVKDPYMMSLSKSRNQKYWFNTQTRDSRFECPPDANPDLPASFAARLVWSWASGRVRARRDQEVPPGGEDGKLLQGEQLLSKVKALIG